MNNFNYFPQLGKASQCATLDDGCYATPSYYGNTADRNWVLQAPAVWRSGTHSEGEFFLSWTVFGDVSASCLMWTVDPQFDPWEWLASIFSLQYPPRNRLKGHESKGNDHQLKMFQIVTQILLVSLIRNVKRKVLRICILMLGCKGWKLLGVRRGLSPNSWGKLFATMERSGLCHWNSIEVVIVLCSYAKH